MSERNSTCSSSRPFSDLERADVGERHARVLGLAAGEAAEHVRVAEDAGTASAPSASRPSRRSGFEFSQQRDSLAGSTAQQLPQAIGNGTTTRSPTFRFLTASPDLDDFAHELVAEDVALLHRRHEAVVEVQVRAADRRRW